MFGEVFSGRAHSVKAKSANRNAFDFYNIHSVVDRGIIP